MPFRAPGGGILGRDLPPNNPKPNNPKPGDAGYLDWLRQSAPPPAGRDYGYEVDERGRFSVGLFDLPAGQGGAGADHYGADLQYQLGLKGVEVDWAQIDINRQRARVEEGQLAEENRSNQAREAAIARQRALDAASNAMQAYTTGTQLADSRRLASLQESRALLPFLVDPNQKYQAGYEPGGPLAAATERFGLPAMQPQEIQRKQLRPGELATAPTEGQIGSGLMAGIEQIRAGGR